jgi:site-specific DNA recombinase
MKHRVAIYARISSDPENNRNGVEMQLKDCRALAKKEKLHVVGTFVDNDVSASDRKKKRPEWQKVLDLITSGEIDGIVCWHPDRLYRRLTDLEAITDLVKTTQDLTIYPVKAAKFDLNDSTGVFVAGMIAAAAKYEVHHKSERQVARHKQIAAEGLWHGGKMPTGYKKGAGKGQLVIDEPIAEALRTSAKLLLNGHSLRSVSKQYRESTGHNMADTALRRVLVGPVVAGIRIYSPEHSRDDKQRMELPSRINQVPAQWEAILDEETWIALKGLLLNPKRKTRGITSELSLLSGLLICGRLKNGVVCGKSLGYGAKAYICNYSSGGCNQMSISTDRIEEHVLGLVDALIKAKDFKLPAPAAQTPNELTEAKRRRLRKNYDDAFDLFTRGIIDSEQLASAKEKLQEQLDKLGPLPKSSESAKAETAKLASLIESWDSAEPPEKRMVIKSLVDRIIITAPDPVRAKANGARFDYERADIQWATWDRNGTRNRPASLKTATTHSSDRK